MVWVKERSLIAADTYSLGQFDDGNAFRFFASNGSLQTLEGTYIHTYTSNRNKWQIRTHIQEEKTNLFSFLILVQFLETQTHGKKNASVR